MELHDARGFDIRSRGKTWGGFACVAREQEFPRALFEGWWDLQGLEWTGLMVRD
jgi:hypothetical protein